MRIAIALFIVGALAFQTAAHTSYTGYSGAPGSNGTCTSSCHAQNDFVPDIIVTGFRSTYFPGQQYTISVMRASGSSIRQFNASVRIGTSSQNAGTISAGLATATYNTTGETNGVHWASASTDSGSFIWTAPPAGTGEVRLYWAGLQGTRSNGADTQLVLISNEYVSNVEYEPGFPESFTLKQNYPNPFNSQTTIEFTVAEPGKVSFSITNILGQLVFNWAETIDLPGTVTVRWDGTNIRGDALPSGIYFYRLETSEGSLTRKMMLLR